MSVNIEHPEGRSADRLMGRRSSEPEELSTFELVCVGFGTTALPLAAALADRDPNARILFVEREGQFHWRPEHVLPDKPVGSSFLRDLVTTQNPRSRFTFVNFLHVTDQLIRFTNNSKIYPSRRLMGEYFRWAAREIQQLGWIRYGQEVVRVQPMHIKGQSIAEWFIELRDTKSHSQTSIMAKKVILATGVQPYIPQTLARAPLVLHSNSSQRLMNSIRAAKQPLSIAIVGADQEAAELFEHLSTARSGKHTATMFFSGSALRPEDDVPDVQDLLEKYESMPGVLPPEVRLHVQHAETSLPKVNPHTLESLYEAQYTQKIHERDPEKWRFQMRPLSEIINTEREGEKICLVVRNPRTGEVAKLVQAYDVVIAATGYSFAINRDLLDIPGALLDGGVVSVDREYQVNFRRGTLATGCSVWLIGSLEDRMMRGDDFSIMAERAQRVAKSVVNEMKKGTATTTATERQYSERAMF